jgi:hypothetical protein
MNSTLLENLVEALRNENPMKPRYESFLGDSMAVKQYANIGLQCSKEFAIASAIVVHEYNHSPEEKSSKEIKAYATALADFIGFFEGCATEMQPEVPKGDT